MNKLIICYGTRPELVKIAPIVWEFRKKKLEDKIIVVCTNQHIDTLDNNTFDIHPDYNLDVFSKNQSLSQLYANIMMKFDSLLHALKNEETNYSILVQGDTATSASIAQTAFLNQIPVLHLEGGLRSKDISSPFPEEYNRRNISLIADFHFVPSEKEKNNLLNENIKTNSIKVSGNTVIDSLNHFYNPEKRNENSDVVLITIHRKSNQNGNYDLLLNQVNKLSQEYPKLKFIWITHHSDILQNKVKQFKSSSTNLKFVSHKNYKEIIEIYESCTLVITDSGGIIEETTRLGIPRIIVRNDNERHGIIELKNSFIYNPSNQNLSETVTKALVSNRTENMIYGDKNIAVKIVEEICKEFLNLEN